MSQTDNQTFLVPPASQVTVPIVGSDALFPVRRIYCVGRNYAAHAVEMGHDPDKDPPFFFQKPADCIVQPGGDFPYPPLTSDVHHELEQVVAIGKGGADIAQADALDHVIAYGVGLDMTRRDLQGVAKKMGRPWEVGKAFEHSAPLSALRLVSDIGHPSAGEVELRVNGEVRQQGDLNQLIWKVEEVIVHLSKLFTLAAGDLIMTGTPSGVAAVSRGDVLVGEIVGIGSLSVTVI